MRHLAASGAVALVAIGFFATPARADVDGFSVKLDQAPATFTIGKAAKTLTAVVSTERESRRCLKVRWALTVETKGVSLDQIRVGRVENNQDFGVRAQIENDAAQIVDERLDPGQLCRDRTVTGQWTVAFTGPDDGEVTFTARALDATGRVLSTTGSSAQVVTPVAASASPSASPSPSPSPTEQAPVAGEDEAVVTEDPEPSAAALVPASSSTSVLGIGLIIGALMVFLGVGMLLRLRARNRRNAVLAAELPTGFYTAPRRR
ncbi:hypothetical protein [Paractinoplanes atraurantiacus]|uniref:LPXTG-motif cell wall anchor domain-containing protein n=1 Tax=Paractinoplanes atraurantiacus TaxID=1036182 RepID=A0A285KMG5_9ACTN|nr:hypothetical protein [Actinoplanes atraurantiacus]SNY73829.1 hypothetical protein SAMN05421748_14912 [Actinoplanes atraurantiacus]